MNEETVNEMYSKLMDDSVSTQDKIEVLKEVSELSDKSNIEYDNNTSNESESEVVMVKHNASDGEIVPTEVLDNETLSKLSSAQFNNFINYIPTEVNKDIISKIVGSGQISNFDDIQTITSMIKRRMNGESVNAYKEFPSSIKQMLVTANVNSAGNMYVNNQILKSAANLLLDNLTEEYKKSANEFVDLEIMLVNFNKGASAIVDDTSKELGSMMMDTDTVRKQSIDAAIENCKTSGNLEGVEKLEKMKSSIDDAYNLDDFIEFCKHVKIKKFDLEKPSRVYSNFINKYTNHKNNITDIRICPDILDRHIKSDHVSNVKLCLAFCKYTMNMSPDNVNDHTFMYYFIRNIITLDRLNPKGVVYDTMDNASKKFYDGFVSNINKCIDNLSNR